MTHTVHTVCHGLGLKAPLTYVCTGISVNEYMCAHGTYVCMCAQYNTV